MSLTNPKTVVTEERLAEFYQQILPYLGGMPEMLANKFSKSDLYSTDEKMIGQWIDGKPLYQKTVACGVFSNSSSQKTVAHNISNIERIINVWGFARNSVSKGTIPLPMQQRGDLEVGIWATSTIINIEWNGDRSKITESYVTLQYTKTTDSPMAIGIDTDYSTEEKIVGTWIDGKPVYQLTFAGIMSNSNYSKTFENMDEVISLLGTFKTTDGYTLGIPRTGGSLSYFTDWYRSGNSITIQTSTNATYKTGTFVATIQYTKTTD